MATNMLRHRRLEHQFVKHIPDHLEAGVLYVSVEYGTVSHLCCCGCGEEVVTPLTPTDWKLIFDGEAVSLWPSIGNWNLSCRSHYVIDRGSVIEGDAWSEARISAELRRDKAAKHRYYGTFEVPAPPTGESGVPSTRTGTRWWSRLRTWLERSGA